MKRKVLVILIIVILIVGGYFGYKGYCLYYYQKGIFLDNITSTQQENPKDPFKIKTKKLDDSQYLHFNGLLLENSLSCFELDKMRTYNNQEQYQCFLEDGKKVKFQVQKYENPYSDSKKIYDDFSPKLEVTKEEFSNYLDKHKLNNEVAIFNYIKKYNYHKNTIFTPVSKMKENYIVALLCHAAGLPKERMITGDLTGYIATIEGNDKARMIYLTHGKYVYVFTHWDIDYFKDEYMFKLLETLQFEEE